MRRLLFLLSLLVLAPTDPARADDRADLEALLAKPVLQPQQTLTELQTYLESRLPSLRLPADAPSWEKETARLRQAVLDRVVFRGEAAAWRDAPLHVEWLDTIPGGPGYHIRKLRYEAVPGQWIPALLYEPEKLSGKVPVSLAVNGHDGNGKAAPYKQIRCINQAKRGMLVLNVEWFGMGQLRNEDFNHARMNQLDLCGTSGVAPFFLSMKRGLDILLSLEHADPARVAVSGLSGGGWQTIFVSALDPRVTLSNPVAGYSGFPTRVRNFSDLGDSEQTPCDLATVADYTHLTAMRAPRPTLLTFNSKDDCCFASGHALEPLLDAAWPAFRLFDKEDALRSHVNDDPGTHNYERDNREAFYRMLGAFFFTGDPAFDPKEIPSDKEVKSAAELNVELPKENRGFHSLALRLAGSLPRDAGVPTEKGVLESWQRTRRVRLREVVHAYDFTAHAERVSTEKKANTQATLYRLKAGPLTVPVVEFVRGEPRGTTILVNDAGRRADPVNLERLLAAGQRVLTVDPFAFGEAKVGTHDYLFALMVATIGDRSLGLQASQLAAVARWAADEQKWGPVAVVAVGPRLATAALIAAGLEDRAVARLELHGAMASLKEILERNRTVAQTPELFCFGLLEAFDVRQLTALVVPRPVTFVGAGAREKAELGGLSELYRACGSDFEPLK